MKGTKKDKKRWGKNNGMLWKEGLCSPWRPSGGDIRNYETGIRLSQGNPKKILILGATPELRDISAKLEAEVWLVDYSKKMIVEMTKFLEISNPRKEEWIIRDWFNLGELKKQNFDVILGDLILRLIPKNKLHPFFNMISELLESGGIFTTRIHFVDKSLEKKTANEIIDKAFFLLDPKVPGRGKRVENLLISRFFDKYHLFGGEKVKKRIKSDIKKYLLVNPGISENRKKILTGVIRRLTGAGLADFSSYEKEGIEAALKSFFVIEKRLFADDYEDAEFFPVYVLKPRI